MLDEDVVDGLLATYKDPGVALWLRTWVDAPDEKRSRLEARMREAGIPAQDRGDNR